MNKVKAESTKITFIFPVDSAPIFDNRLTNTFGGATVQMYLYAREFSNYNDVNIDCLVADFGRKDGELINGLKILNTFNENDKLFIKIIKFHKAIHKAKPDILIQHGLTFFSCLLSLYCKIFKIKFIYMFASDVEADGCYQKNNKKATLFKFLIKYTDVIITQNQYQYRKIYNNYGRSTIILYSGFPIENSPNIHRDSILWIGRAEKLKNPLKFLNLASLIPDQNFIMICNKIVEQEDYFNEIKYLADNIENLEFISYVPFNKIDTYFMRAKLLINTSEYEGFPQVFIQAAMNKLPIVSLNINPDGFLTQYNCGIICNDNEIFMKESIQNLLINSKKYIQLSKNAYEYAKEKHNIEINARTLYELILTGKLNKKK